MALVSLRNVELSLDHGHPLRGVDVAAHYLSANRPWLTLYGLRVRPAHSEDSGELGLIQTLIPDELMLAIFVRLDPHAVGRASCVCRQWRILGDNPAIWQRACSNAFRHSTYSQNMELVLTNHRGSWKKMFLERPHLRFDGLFISRNTYLRTGIAEWRVKNPVHMVAYFRYLRFYPDGRVLYRTSPEKPTKVSRSMKSWETSRKLSLSSDVSGVLCGKYRIKDDLLSCVTVYPNSKATEFRMRMKVRSTTPGANNRLDLRSIATKDNDGSEQVVLDADDPGAEDDPEGALKHKRGMASFIFVPWEKIESCPYNLPVDKMDFYVCG
ncbi:hypothetical protein BSKO_01652 [Bryopsis sp. KO-2023]|nr:hypothetical protein BSKO_01652 [Bryopsis sp. KO-2023]